MCGGVEGDRELEVERSRNAVLAAALSSAKAERKHAQAEAAAARQRAQQLEQKLDMANSIGDFNISFHVGQPLDKKHEQIGLPKVAQNTGSSMSPMYVD